MSPSRRMLGAALVVTALAGVTVGVLVGRTGSTTPGVPDAIDDPDVDAASVPGADAAPDPDTGPQPVAGDGDFVESFDANGGLERFRTGVFHRDVDAGGFALGTAGERTWTGDHAHEHDGDDCGPPDTGRLLDKTELTADAVYVCRDHLMTSMGDVDFYSIVWFSPDAVFHDQDTVSWHVNTTYLGERQWVEVMIAAADAPDLTCAEGLPCDVPSYPDDAVVVGIGGPWGNGVKVDGSTEFTTWQPLCGDEYALDPEGCASKPIRRPWSITDNRDGTMTLRFLEHAWEIAGSFPDAPWKVVFKDHNYTPDKDGPVQGHTWHWDDIAITTG